MRLKENSGEKTQTAKCAKINAKGEKKNITFEY